MKVEFNGQDMLRAPTNTCTFI